MKSTIRLHAFMSTQCLMAAAFSPVRNSQRVEWTPRHNRGPATQASEECRTRMKAATTSPPTDAKVEVKTDTPVSRISVCAGELCQCQGEQYEFTGGASDAAIEELTSLGLPFPVDEVGCLGACGMGTMIAIDFDNGDSIMTDGLESTLVELGIQRQDTAPFVPLVDSESTESGVVAESAEDKTGDTATVPSIPITASTSTSEASGDKAKPNRPPPELVDVRDRMREEAVDDVENPWVNMASYLAKKAVGNLFGFEQSKQ